MSFFSFLHDRLPYIIAYFTGLVLVVAVAELDAMQQGVSLRPGNLGYLFLLSFVVLIVALSIDYARQRLFLFRLKQAGQARQGMPGAAALQSPVTNEQHLVQTALLSQHRGYERQLADLRQRVDLHQHFITQWAHSMKTPVSVIDLLIQQTVDAEISSSTEVACDELLESIEEENQRIAHGLELMLHMARLEKFEVDVQPGQTDLVALAREVINSHKKEFLRYEIFPSVVGDAEQVWVETDKKWLAFVLNQLVTNAIKYARMSDRPSKQVVARVERVKGTPQISVTDNGVGIPPEDLPRVFEPFFTGKNGRLGAQSTGMGLYLAQQVCRRLGHEISVQSDFGVETKVTVTLPTGAHVKVTKT